MPRRNANAGARYRGSEGGPVEWLETSLHRQWNERRQQRSRQRYLDRRALRDGQDRQTEAEIERFRRTYIEGEVA